MSCYLIRVENGHKVARSITSEEEYKMLRGSNEQKANLRLARAGNDAAKRRLMQFNYSGHYPQGVVKGMKLPSQAFGFDLDDKEAFEKAAELLLKEPEKYGLLMLERSARQGGHAVCKREMGKTILENQVRIATMLKCEMDTSAHDINRVYFTSSLPNSFRMLTMKLPWRLKARYWRSERSMDRRNFLRGLTRRINITNLGKIRQRMQILTECSRRGLRRMTGKIMARNQEWLKRQEHHRPRLERINLQLQFLRISSISESHILKSSRNGGRCIMTVRNRFVPTATH